MRTAYSLRLAGAGSRCSQTRAGVTACALLSLVRGGIIEGIVDVSTDKCQDDGSKRFKVQAINVGPRQAPSTCPGGGRNVGKRTSLARGIEDTH